MNIYLLYELKGLYHQLVWLSACPLLDGCARRGFESSYPTGVGFGLWFLKKNEVHGWSPSRGHHYVLVVLTGDVSVGCGRL